jgi:hypothetical protein
MYLAFSHYLFEATSLIQSIFFITFCQLTFYVAVVAPISIVEFCRFHMSSIVFITVFLPNRQDLTIDSFIPDDVALPFVEVP